MSGSLTQVRAVAGVDRIEGPVTGVLQAVGFRVEVPAKETRVPTPCRIPLIGPFALVAPECSVRAGIHQQTGARIVKSHRSPGSAETIGGLRLDPSRGGSEGDRQATSGREVWPARATGWLRQRSESCPVGQGWAALRSGIHQQRMRSEMGKD